MCGSAKGARGDRGNRHDVYVLWQTETRNLIEDFTAEADALAAVRQMVEESGASALAEVVLLAGSRDGDAPMRRGRTSCASPSAQDDGKGQFFRDMSRTFRL
jgi:hypothetical protein